MLRFRSLIRGLFSIFRDSFLCCDFLENHNCKHDDNRGGEDAAHALCHDFQGNLGCIHSFPPLEMCRALQVLRDDADYQPTRNNGSDLTRDIGASRLHEYDIALLSLRRETLHNA